MTSGTGALHQVSRALGALEEGFKNLKEGLDRESLDAKQHRESLRAVIDALTEAMRSLTSEVAAVKRDVKEMKPIVEDYEQKRSEARGRAKLGRNIHKIWIGIGGATALAGLMAWLSQHWKWLLLFVVLSVVAAAARDDGQWAQRNLSPAQKKWFLDQKEPGTQSPCCNDSDGEEVQEDIRDGVYWVLSEKTRGEWIEVPAKAVLTEPNKWGQPVAWFWYGNDGQGRLQVRCFAPGAGI